MYYKTKNELYSAKLEDKIDRLLKINALSCNQSIKKFMKDKSFCLNDIKERNLEIGALVEGEAYFHEEDEYYDVIGFIVKAETEFRGVRSIQYGFRSIYFGKCNEYAPVDFDDGTSIDNESTYGNGLGDFVEITDVLVTKKEVNRIIKENNIDINKYLRDMDLLLPKKEKSKSENSLNI